MLPLTKDARNGLYLSYRPLWTILPSVAKPSQNRTFGGGVFSYPLIIASLSAIGGFLL